MNRPEKGVNRTIYRMKNISGKRKEYQPFNIGNLQINSLFSTA